FPDQGAAIAALQAGEIQGFHVIPIDYPDNLQVDLYYLDERPDHDVLVDFDNFVRANLLKQGPNQIQSRIIEGSDLIVRSASGEREFREGVGFVAVLLPFVVTLFFVFAVMSSAGYFLQAVTDEKENRTMEIMITSISPEQLIAGKALGLMAVALTLVVIWVFTLVVSLLVAPRFIEELQGITLPWEVLVVFAAFFIPSFALIAGMMTAIGGTVTELQEGQQIAGFMNLLFTFPLFLSVIVFANPNSPVLIMLSFFPTTAFITLTMRWGFTIIPTWQLIVSWCLLTISAVLSIWAASKIFRLGMLRYGQRLNLKSALSALRINPPRS
ncbi:MAG: ABC transporter permease, partial [Anaerolineales bacterium]